MTNSKNRKRLWVALLIGGVLLAITLSQLAAQTSESRHVFVGVVSDSSCGVKHKTDNAKQCTEACIGNGASYVLVINDVVHKLQGNPEEFKKFAGEKVEISASLDGNTLKVARIGPVSQPL